MCRLHPGRFMLQMVAPHAKTISRRQILLCILVLLEQLLLTFVFRMPTCCTQPFRQQPLASTFQSARKGPNSSRCTRIARLLSVHRQHPRHAPECTRACTSVYIAVKSLDRIAVEHCIQTWLMLNLVSISCLRHWNRLRKQHKPLIKGEQ